MSIQEDRYNTIIKLLESGRTVYLSTIYRSLKLTIKHIKLLSFKNDHIYVNKIDYTYTKTSVI